MKKHTFTSLSSQEALEKMRKEEISAPPYLKTRILARMVNNPSRSRFRPLFVYSSSAVAFIFIAVLSVFVYQTNLPKIHIMPLHEITAIQVDATAFANKEISHVRIKVPQNVYFYSDEYPEISKNSELLIDWQQIQAANFMFPVIINAKTGGLKKIQIEYVNHDSLPIKNQEINIHFTNHLEKQGG